MAAAVPTINGIAGSNPPNGTALVVGSTVQLDNVNAGGEITYLWELLDVPEGSLAALSNAALQNPTFVADCEGTYLIKLTVNRTLATEVSSKIIAAVSQLKSALRIPAAGESTEASTQRGWALSANRDLIALDNLYADPNSTVGIAAGTESLGHVLYISSIQTIKVGLPGEEKLPVFSSALASSLLQADKPLYVFIGKVGGGASVSAGNYLRAKLSGLVGPIGMTGGSVGDSVFLDNTGKMDVTAGTYARRVGTIAYIDGSDYYVAFNGSLGHHEGVLFMTPALTGVCGVVARGGDLELSTADTLGVVRLANANGQSWKIDAAGNWVAAASQLVQNVDTPLSDSDAANKGYVDSASLLSAKSALVYGNGSSPGASTECSLDPGFGARTSPSVGGAHPRLLAPCDGTVRNLRVHAEVGPAGAGLDFTVIINHGGTPAVTSITCTLGVGGNDTSDLTHTANVQAGDFIEVHLKGAGIVTGGCSELTASLQFNPR
jgi:hypothetical protein